MYTNKTGCTVYERVVGSDRMEAYKRHFIPLVYWEDARGQTQSGNSEKQQDVVLCIIPESSLNGYIPKRNDRLVYGKCTGSEPPSVGTVTIMDVKDFRYGSAGVRHLEVTAV